MGFRIMRRRFLFLVSVASLLALGAAACGDSGGKASSGSGTISFKALDAGGPLTKAALTKGDIQIALIFTSDADIAINKWVLLQDDKKLQPADNLIPAIRKSADSTD